MPESADAFHTSRVLGCFGDLCGGGEMVGLCWRVTRWRIRRFWEVGTGSCDVPSLRKRFLGADSRHKIRYGVWKPPVVPECWVPTFASKGFPRLVCRLRRTRYGVGYQNATCAPEGSRRTGKTGKTGGGEHSHPVPGVNCACWVRACSPSRRWDNAGGYHHV